MTAIADQLLTSRSLSRVELEVLLLVEAHHNATLSRCEDLPLHLTTLEHYLRMRAESDPESQWAVDLVRGGLRHNLYRTVAELQELGYVTLRRGFELTESAGDLLSTLDSDDEVRDGRKRAEGIVDRLLSARRGPALPTQLTHPRS